MNKSEEVRFLASEFAVQPTRAAALVADSEAEALALAAAEVKRQHNEDAYGDAPVPVSPEEHEIPENGGLQKTVIGKGQEIPQ